MSGLILVDSSRLVALIVFLDVARNGFGQLAVYGVGLITLDVSGLILVDSSRLVAAYGSRQIFADRIGHILGRRIRDILRLIVDVSVFGRQVDIRCGLFHRCFCRAVCDGMRRFCGRVDFAVGISVSVQHFL